MKCPCMGCDKRLVGCHSLCPDYQGWKKENEANRVKPQEQPELCRAMKKHIWRNLRWR